jgi:hypothetical protein
MKKNYAYIAILCIAVLSCYYLFSCQKKNQPKDHKTESALTVNLLGHPTKVFNYGRTALPLSRNMAAARKETYDFVSITADMEAGELTSFIQSVRSNYSGGELIPSNLNGCIIYTEQVEEVSDYALVTGIVTTQAAENGKIRWRMFAIENLVVTEMSAFDLETDYYTAVEVIFFAREFEANTFLFVQVPGEPPAENPSEVNMVAKYVVDLTDVLEDADAGGALTCRQCNIPADGICKIRSGHKACELEAPVLPPICPLAAINAKGIEANIFTEETDFSLETGHSFRDDFMRSTAMGRKYVSYYYKLGYLIGVYKAEAVNLSNIADLINLGSGLYEIRNKLVSGIESDIIVTSSFRTLANSIIENYRSISHNAEFQSILTDIQNDLTNFEGMNRAQVLAEIEE